MLGNDVLKNCLLCPRNCGADRFSGNAGYCNTNNEIPISHICIHRGEEPAISGKYGICNLFFYHCNLQCIYCQNFQISKNSSTPSYLSLSDTINQIEAILEQGVKSLGFVSPSHVIPQMLEIINEIGARGKHPVFVYNTSAYDKVELLKTIEDKIHVYLPDYKYSDNAIAKQYSGAADYPQIALKAIKEMYRQKGSTLIYDDENIAESGLIIRHLVLPGHVENSLNVLRNIADELSANVKISLMSQYYPTEKMREHLILSRTLREDEYMQVVEEMNSLGFRNGWIQEFESNSHYRPDFNQHHPFEN